MDCPECGEEMQLISSSFTIEAWKCPNCLFDKVYDKGLLDYDRANYGISKED